MLLDSRQNVSYPDGAEDKDGVIRIIYDYKRYGGGILMATCREEDAIQGKNVSGVVRLRQMIDSLGK